ncbi:MAG TPA: DUF4446 family protein [Syntrophomonadaceae bacterium]|nr:DUF4446 family protein [Syntrophomonadaceae bacterium]
MGGIWLVQGNKTLLIIYALFGISILLFLILNIHLLLVGRRYRRLMRGVNGANLEKLLEETVQSCRAAEKRVDELEELCRELKQFSTASIRRVGFVRFNAFSDMGSDLSFALALLNETGDGVILCCLVSREDCRLYAKPVEGGASPYPLSDEEEEAIRKALEAGSSLKR